ncbi:hypothetical protein [Lentiprolixibacter aurantiacus]|uniref:NIPSNAP domain-containing protein n=1 Tax=Lentiprolixibacter aurantiacus TaxID=2993939 RepID=A0AAE3SNC8_9FLAO|nr:hypothetical protein [Lentiprolixibacter aurantiacus]MCX2719370.1 hypothetical protein [Lentiprolixibacter aurantiacus]
MKKTFLFLFTTMLILGYSNQLTAQEAESPLWETIILIPDNTKLKTLGENMRKHNQKYHKEGPYQASVYNIVTGPDTGKMVWIMGPLQYRHLDARPSAGGHDEDWRDNILTYVRRVQQGEYWAGDIELSNTGMMGDDPGDYPILFTRYWEIREGMNFGVQNHFKMVSETVKAMPGENPFGIYVNEFQQGDIGRHIATVSFHKSWTDFEKSWPFPETFEKVHGANSWDRFIRNRDATFDNRWDEIWVYNKELSGN